MRVIGLGNPMRHDDGAGIAVARGLKARLPTGLDVAEVDGSALAVIGAFAGAGEVLMVDAVAAPGVPPGTILDDLAEGLPMRAAAWGGASSHGLGLLSALALARELGRLPARLKLVGIVGSDFSMGEGLSPDVARAVVDLVDRLGTARGRSSCMNKA